MDEKQVFGWSINHPRRGHQKIRNIKRGSVYILHIALYICHIDLHIDVHIDFHVDFSY